MELDALLLATDELDALLLATIELDADALDALDETALLVGGEELEAELEVVVGPRLVDEDELADDAEKLGKQRELETSVGKLPNATHDEELDGALLEEPALSADELEGRAEDDLHKRDRKSVV